MSYVAEQAGTKLPIEILLIIITYLPSAKYFFKCTCLSHTINSHLKSSATRQQWLLNLPPSPSVLFIANKMKISLPFEHARSAMEHGVDKSHMKSILALSEHYLNNAIPPFLSNIYLSRQLSPDEISVLEEVYLQYFVFREATKRQEDSKTKWIECTFGKTDIDDHNISAWVNHAFELSVSDFYTTIAKRIASN
ncbi:hypothetical protein K450DRAFT_272081 [Umbelopsis ramanniana AG]|uniref:F-box domain-containing protein n=1 Tax=Umbelopsis ramanniana AG TaxID=1314678 RepID=A0AAD5E8D8_UMBRA|nr:uncharacterized protein K450DRAFT_272081 [Umbelopsis ramanniana AG]KAI8579298.1 hypothetical protein K450DRAFT_272081 [Umbelopsis ramanniana AG]